MQELWQLWRNRFGPDECQRIINTAIHLPVSEGAVGTDASRRTDETYRRSKVRWLSRQDPGWQPLFTRLDDLFQQSNNRAFGFDLTYFSEIQFTEYSADYAGTYDWHEDTSWVKPKQPASHRKLSLVLQLSDPRDYDGGDLELDQSSPDPHKLRSRGAVLVFPSFLRHRVTPVTRGVRYSLVTWYEGPHFR